MRSFLACLFLIPTLSSFSWALNATEELKVRTTLSQFAVLMDVDDFSKLDTIFTEDVFADYGTTKSYGLPEFSAFLERGLKGRSTQHAISSTVIEDHGTSLNSTAYVTCAFLGPGKNTTTYVGDVATLYGRYLDTWTSVGGAWKINQRIFSAFVSTD
ncbi:MAG: hypothetical protein Q9219_003483 [cf. Caloplaca sp. 3 TL-2023]